MNKRFAAIVLTCSIAMTIFAQATDGSNTYETQEANPPAEMNVEEVIFNPVTSGMYVGNVLTEEDITEAIAALERKRLEEEAKRKAAEEAARKAAEEAKRKAEEAAKGKYLGDFKLTFYTPDPGENGGSTLTATGKSLSANVWKAVAVDPRVIPLGSTVYIEGFGTFTAEDTGGAIKGNKIDVLVGSSSEAYNLGIKYAKVYVK